MTDIDQTRDIAKALYKGHLDTYRKIGPPWNLLDKFDQGYWLGLADTALSTQAGRVAELEMRLSQAADNLAVCARLYNCPGAAEAERLARKALGREDGEG